MGGICAFISSSLIAAGLICVSLTACASGSAFERFKYTMERQVGKSADDPHISINRYSEKRGSAQTIGNGNIVEQEYRFRPGCLVYFEIDKASQKIIGWRYEGMGQNCALP